MPHHQNAGQNHNLLIIDISFENGAKFKHLGMTITHQNCIPEEIKGRSNSGNTCYHSVQNLLSSHLPPKNLKIKIYKIIILSVFFSMDICHTKGRHRLRVFENRVLRRIFWT
jgi:hypothetical protein